MRGVLYQSDMVCAYEDETGGTQYQHIIVTEEANGFAVWDTRQEMPVN
jgi:hypothetical protein